MPSSRGISTTSWLWYKSMTLRTKRRVRLIGIWPPKQVVADAEIALAVQKANFWGHDAVEAIVGEVHEPEEGEVGYVVVTSCPPGLSL